jgi:hypothetical protein
VVKRLREVLDADFKSRRRHPFVDQNVLDRFEKLCGELETNLTARRQQHRHLIHDDPYLDQITILLEGKVGDPFDEKTSDTVFAEAKSRYKRDIPPGFKDKGKPEPECYGDYVAWKQILDYAAAKKTSVILVTDDAKEDWWLRIHGETIGPLPLLVEEFRRTTSQDFYMYSVDLFMENAGDFLGTPVPPEAIQEAKEQRVKNRDETDSLKAEPVREIASPSDLKAAPAFPTSPDAIPAHSAQDECKDTSVESRYPEKGG